MLTMPAAAATVRSVLIIVRGSLKCMADRLVVAVRLSALIGA
jgi:hypothetical protein